MILLLCGYGHLALQSPPRCSRATGCTQKSLRDVLRYPLPICVPAGGEAMERRLAKVRKFVAPWAVYRADHDAVLPFHRTCSIASGTAALRNRCRSKQCGLCRVVVVVGVGEFTLGSLEGLFLSDPSDPRGVAREAGGGRSNRPQTKKNFTLNPMTFRVLANYSAGGPSHSARASIL